MMDLHSLMEINFSVRGFKCFAYGLLALPILLYAKPLAAGGTVKARKQTRTAGVVLLASFAVYLAVFGGLLDICPLLNMDNLGRLIPRSKIRGKKRVMKEIVAGFPPGLCPGRCVRP